MKPCTCHPADNPPDPCAGKYALTDCRRAEIERLRAERDEAVSAVRRWHKTAVAMRDMSITGEGDIEDCYFDAAMSIPFYGVEDDINQQKGDASK